MTETVGFFLVIKYLYRQTQWLILVLPVKTAIFRWEIHHDPAPKKALDEGVSDAHFVEKLLGPGPPGPWAAGFCWTDLESFAGFSSSKAKLDDLSLPIITYLININ